MTQTNETFEFVSARGGGNSADFEKAEIWEGSLEEEGVLRVRLWELQSDAGVWGGRCPTSVSFSHSQAWEEVPPSVSSPWPSLCERSGQGAQEARKVGCWARCEALTDLTETTGARNPG